MTNVDDRIDREDRKEAIVKYTSTSTLLIGYMEEKDIVLTLRGRAGLVLWSAWLACLMDLDGPFQTSDVLAEW